MPCTVATGGRDRGAHRRLPATHPWMGTVRHVSAGLLQPQSVFWPAPPSSPGVTVAAVRAHVVATPEPAIAMREDGVRPAVRMS